MWLRGAQHVVLVELDITIWALPTVASLHHLVSRAQRPELSLGDLFQCKASWILLLLLSHPEHRLLLV
jgi:hypothetical protein